MDTFGKILNLTDEEIIDEKLVGFVYEIKFLDDSTRYIGRKNFISVRTLRALKGKKRKRKTTTISNWRTYTSSNKEVQEKILRTKSENIRFRILEVCDTNISLTYFESKYLFASGAIEKNSIYLNSNIQGKFFKGKI